jgi:hypothetical protein
MITITSDAISSVELSTIFEEVSVYSSVTSSSGDCGDTNESFNLEIEPDSDVFEELEIEPDQLFEVLRESYSEEGLITLLKGWLAATDPEYVEEEKPSWLSLMEIQKKADEIDYMLLYMNLMSDMNSLVYKHQTVHHELKGDAPLNICGGKL